MAGEDTGSVAIDCDAAVDIVIVNWNSRSFLRECLTALDRSSLAESLGAIIVDNNSSDGSADQLKAERLRLDIVRNRENRGFAAACNQGAVRGKASHLLFLNPDVRVEPNTVMDTVQYLSDPAHSGVGVVGIQLLDAEGHVRRSCARTPTVAALLLRTLFLDRICPSLVRPHFLVEWDHGDTRPVDQVSGAFLMIRRRLFEQLGGFDERFFLYYEDVELCLAARQAGWAVVHFAGARAEHAGGGSTRAIRDVRLCRRVNSQVQFTAKRHGRMAAIVLTLAILSLELPIRLLHAAVVQRDGRWVVRGIGTFWRSLPNLFKQVMAGA